MAPVHTLGALTQRCQTEIDANPTKPLETIISDILERDVSSTVWRHEIGLWLYRRQCWDPRHYPKPRSEASGDEYLIESLVLYFQARIAPAAQAS